MTLKSLTLAVVAGGAAYVLLKSSQKQEPQVQTIYVSQPTAAPENNTSGLAKWLPFVDLAVGLLDRPDGEPIFNFGGNGNDSAPLIIDRNPTNTFSSGGEQGILDMIARYEGGVNGYDVVYGGSVIQPPRPITQMTVQQVRDWQDQSVRAGSASSAVGKYQIIRSTMDGLISKGAISRNELFGVDCQERAGRSLLEGRGYSDYKSGRISETAFAQNLSKEWASLPAVTSDRAGRTASGQSYYAGDGLNAAHYSIDQLLSAVRAA